MLRAFLPPLAIQPPTRRIVQSVTPRRPIKSTPIHRRPKMSAAITPNTAAPSLAGNNPVFAQVMLRISNPDLSIPFYESLGMRQITRLDFPAMSFSLIFLAFTDAAIPDLPQPQRAAALWAAPYPTVELTWNWPDDSPPEKYVNGNEPPLGYGHVAIVASGISAIVQRAEKAGGAVVHAADDASRAVVQDPDGYHVELVERGSGPEDAVFSATMLRIKDPVKAVRFFEQIGFTFLTRVDDEPAKTSDFYLAYTQRSVPHGTDCAAKVQWLRELRSCQLLLRHHWGTELVEEQMYVNGNEKPHRGFGHVGIIVDDIYDLVAQLEKEGYKVIRQPGPFTDVGELAFVAEPSTGYWIEIIKRAGKAADSAYEKPVFGA